MTDSIKLDEPSQAFYHGVSLANETLEALRKQPGFSDYPFEQQYGLFMLYVGLNANRDLAGPHTAQFVAGVTTGAPRRDEVLLIEISTSNDAFAEDAEAEVNRILRKAMDQGRFAATSGGFRDTNGTTVGTFRYIS